MQKIIIEGVEISVVRKRIRNIHLKVLRPDGRVIISAPMLVGQKFLAEFAATRIGWIKKHQERIINSKPLVKPLYHTGEKHYLFGAPYSLEVIENSGREHIKLNDDRIMMFLKESADEARREQIMEKWYGMRLVELIPDILNKWQPVIGVVVKQTVVRKMKSRWGSCNIAMARIAVNLELAKRPAHLLEYIIVHEMTHLLERGHNARFYGFMERWIPEWKEYRKELRGGIL